jgi:adenylosuccinate synthase
VGWLDAVLLRYAVHVNGIDELAVTKMDILSGLEKVSICTAYERDGVRCEHPPLGLSDLGSFTPVYEELPGWQADLGAVRRWGDLPAEARGYLQRIAELAGVPVRLVSVGPERDQVVEGTP